MRHGGRAPHHARTDVFGAKLDDMPDDLSDPFAT